MTEKIAVLFDCDGVLVDSEPALAQIAAEVLRARGLAARPEDFAPFIGTGEDTYIGEVVKMHGGKYVPEIKDEVYAAYIREAGDYVKSFPGCLDLLAELKSAGVKTAVASSADLIKVKANLKALGFSGFDAVISGSDIERKKPFPDIYLLAAERLGFDPSACLVVEDATAGIEAGNRAGMTTIAFTSACSASEMEAAGADYVAGSFSEIREIIRKFY